MKNTNTIIGIAVALLVVAGGSFYGGLLYGKSKSAGPSGGRFQDLTSEQRQARMQLNGGSGNNGLATGEIISQDDKSITVKLPDGGSKIIFYSSSTIIGKMATSTAADLTLGESVMATGTANSDGSITAQSIQVRPNSPTQAPAQTPPPAQ
ncbi:MAG: hypothetical protein WC675_03695 [Patescibacteria group bacterium]